ncbi:MAG: YIP1 family protein [Methanocorpusculum sp.]|nr:YIP1 family protein [Methanocorpusculum sp.]
MNFFPIANLFLHPKKFYEQNAVNGDAPRGLLISALLTLIYSILSSAALIPAVIRVLQSGEVQAGLENAVIATTISLQILSIFVEWAIVALWFFLFLRYISSARCTYTQVLAVTGYVSAILSIGAIVSGVAAILYAGAAPLYASFLITSIFLVWSIPLWYFGCSSICSGVPKKEIVCSIALLTAVMLACSLLRIVLPA